MAITTKQKLDNYNEEARKLMNMQKQPKKIVIEQPIDIVNHPPHYKANGMEVIEVIEAFNLGYNLGNTVKYCLRAGKKDKNKIKEDLEKAKWYLEREINYYE